MATATKDMKGGRPARTRKDAQALAIGPAPKPAEMRKAFDVSYLRHVFDWYPAPTLGSWDLGRIRDARDMHAEGIFEMSAELADFMLTDAAVFAAALQRIGPPFSIQREVVGSRVWNGKGLAETVRAESEALFDDDARALPPGTLGGTFIANAFMGASIQQCVWYPSEDGARLDLELRPWPMRSARFNRAAQHYELVTRDGIIVPEHGDGKWVIYEPFGPESHRFGALRPLSFAMADRGFAERDASNHSGAHGSPSVLGTMPQDIPVDSEEGKIFMGLLRQLHQARSGMLKPFGSTVEFLEAKTLAWQIFEKVIGRRGSDIAKALLGQDGTSQNAGGTYTKALLLDGVRFDIVKLDCRIASPINTGALRPFAIVNWGREDLAAQVRWLVPDLREQARRAAIAEQHKAFTDTIQGYEDAGFDVDQTFVDITAKEFGLKAPRIAEKKPAPDATAAPPPAGGGEAPASPSEKDAEEATA